LTITCKKSAQNEYFSSGVSMERPKKWMLGYKFLEKADLQGRMREFKFSNKNFCNLKANSLQDSFVRDVQ
jgi:hypothetical protein